MTFLDIIIDGEIVKEAMLLDLSDGEEVLYKGPSLPKEMKKIAYIIMRNAPWSEYVILSSHERKYLIISTNRSRYLILGLSKEVNAEIYLDQIKRVLDNIGKKCYRNLNID
ncbi:MAG: hypothetical protein N3D12_06070 [Candidatus Methanomethyliaceae archaeon]|nr:hypothetical protein [Candidatus Methanomethyliaceae archaeon]